MASTPVSLFLCGDVMLGRGVDQVLPHPGDPHLREEFVGDARGYVRSAEAVNGPIPRPVEYTWPWGEALAVLDDAQPDVRIVNLETSVTSEGDFAPYKAVHYRMNPGNLPSLAAVRPDACVLANNHVLDFGRAGLLETLDVLHGAGLRTVGAGRDAGEAARPAVLRTAEGARVVVAAFGMPSSGVPVDWAAAEHTAGVDFLADASEESADHVLERVARVAEPGDVVVVSIHWGGNWGYDVDRAMTAFACRLIDGGVDVVHGHSSHHPRAVQVYHGKLILYGCGDCVDDYEGISGYEYYRDDLRLLYLATVRPDDGDLVGLRMVPMQAHRMRLRHAGRDDAEWLATTLSRVSRPFGCDVGVDADGDLALLR